MSKTAMNKQQWVALFREIGLDEAAMQQWHREFESRYPHGHESFLQSMGTDQQEIKQIRKWSRRGDEPAGTD